MTFVQSQTNIFWKIFPIHARLFVETRQQEVKKELERRSGGGKRWQSRNHSTIQLNNACFI